jgi:paraquat-inducible protein A
MLVRGGLNGMRAMDGQDAAGGSVSGSDGAHGVASLLVLASALCFGLGITLPLVTLDRLWVFSEEPSLLQIVGGLWTNGDVALSAIVALVSLVFPAVKLVWLQFVAARVTTRGLHRLHALGRWSMMDVLVVALVVFGAKTSGLAEAVARPGLWFYGAATLAAAAAAMLLERAGVTARPDGGHR